MVRPCLSVVSASVSFMILVCPIEATAYGGSAVGHTSALWSCRGISIIFQRLAKALLNPKCVLEAHQMKSRNRDAVIEVVDQLLALLEISHLVDFSHLSPSGLAVHPNEALSRKHSLMLCHT